MVNQFENWLTTLAARGIPTADRETPMRGDEKVRDHVLRGIADGQYRPGDRLPTERQLCGILLTGRAAVRDALAVLESEGRVRRKGGSGTFVAETAPDRRARPVSPADVMAARLAFEPSLALMVVTRATAEDFALMQTCLAQGDTAPDLLAFEHWDAALHAAIVNATHNPLIDQVYALITAARQQDDWGALKRRSLTPDRRANYQADHARIVSAVLRRDAGAAEAALRAHLVAVSGNLLDP
jgi:DNA-binding FadR family transcriptional regulator